MNTTVHDINMPAIDNPLPTPKVLLFEKLVVGVTEQFQFSSFLFRAPVGQHPFAGQVSKFSYSSM